MDLSQVFLDTVQMGTNLIHPLAINGVQYKKKRKYLDFSDYGDTIETGIGKHNLFTLIDIKLLLS